MNNADQKEWLVIVNPNAGNGKGKKDWTKISEQLRNEGFSFLEKFTERRGHAIEFTIEGIKKGFRKIITVGGDGTLNEVVNGICNNEICPPSEIVTGLVPVGTGNDWGRMFGITLDHQQAIGIIKRNKQMLHDIGVIKYFDSSGQKTRYFINIAGLGFESDVVRRTNYQKDRGHGGRLIYFYNLLRSLFSYRNGKVEIKTESEKLVTDMFSINIGNGRYCGGGMRQTPKAVPDDGLLDVTVIKKIGKFEIIRNLKILYNGKILTHPKISGYRCKTLYVNSESSIYVEADGESLGHTPAEFGIIPSGIRIIYGTKLFGNPDLE
jgi:YegS/Rv2252/BmrU family lipid kinase